MTNVSNVPAGTEVFDLEARETRTVTSVSATVLVFNGGFVPNWRNTCSAIEAFRVTFPKVPTGTGYLHASRTTRLDVEFVHRRLNGRFRTPTWPAALMSISVFTIFREPVANSCSPVRFQVPLAGTFPNGVGKMPSRVPVPPVSTVNTSCATPRTMTFETPRTSARRVPFRNTEPSNVELKRYSQRSPAAHAGAVIDSGSGPRTVPGTSRRAAARRTTTDRIS